MKKAISLLIVATLAFGGAGCEKIEAPPIPPIVKYAGTAFTQGHSLGPEKDKYRRRDSYLLYNTLK